MENSLRDTLKDRLSLILETALGVNRQDVYEIVCDLADEVFAVLGIDEELQDSLY